MNYNCECGREYFLKITKSEDENLDIKIKCKDCGKMLSQKAF